LHNSCFQLFLSTLAVVIVFIIGLLNDSAWEFARGYDGVTRQSLNPMFSAYCRNGYQLNADSLSVLMTFGIPKVDMTLSSTGITVVADSDLIISTIGYLEYSSVITNKESPLGNGPQMSAVCPWFVLTAFLTF
jgi:hypothetical protein